MVENEHHIPYRQKGRLPKAGRTGLYRVGRELISLTRQKAIDQGFDSLSLIALADNTDAHRLYFRCGFEIVSIVEMEPHELIPHEGGAYLLRCPVE